MKTPISLLFLISTVLAAMPLTRGLAETGHSAHEAEYEHESHPSGSTPSAHEEEHQELNVGPNKGVTEFSEENGFKLSKEAFETFGIQTQKATNVESITLPKAALISSGELRGVFRLKNGFFKMLPVTVVRKSTTSVHIRGTSLKAGDTIVTQGAQFLRIAELDATSGEAEGHSH